MDTTNLRDTYPELIAHMEGQGYSRLYVTRLEREIRRILSSADSCGWNSYADIYASYANTTESRTYLGDRLKFLGIVERFDLRGEFPDGRTWQQIKSRRKYQLLSPEFKRVIDTYLDFETGRGAKKATTIRDVASSAAGFLHGLQLAGIGTVAKITQASVISAFLDSDGTPRRSCSYRNSLAAVFKANVPRQPAEFSRIVSYLPELCGTRRNIQYLTDDEVAKVRAALSFGNAGLSLRDIAVGTLALCYGLRRSDIAGLKLEDVDLARDRISIRQQKTGVPLELPLTAAAGNAIFDYVMQERPESGEAFVFLSERCPHGQLGAGGVSAVAAKIMKAAGMRQASGDRKGFHIFRHRLATDLLGNGVPQPVISRILGHTAPESIETYLSADFVHLKECALSIESYPVGEGVFANA